MRAADAQLATVREARLGGGTGSAAAAVEFWLRFALQAHDLSDLSYSA
jgi:hypothetical protein